MEINIGMLFNCKFILRANVTQFRSQHLYIRENLKGTDCEVHTMCNLLQMSIHVHVIHGVENTILEHCIY